METKTVYFRFLQAKEACILVAQGMREKHEKLRFFGDYIGHIYDAVDYIIQTAYSGGDIAIKYMVDACTEAAKIYDAFKFFYHLERTNRQWYENQGVIFGDVSEDSNDDIIAIGELTEDFQDGDSDPYQTAGGYRNWIALKGTKVTYHLNSNLSVLARFESNCTEDHYNNNFCGVSTGGGTTKYQIGERKGNRGVILGREFLDKGWSKSKIATKMLFVDSGKAMRLCAKYHPEFADVLR